jgi:hypothetical protein
VYFPVMLPPSYVHQLSQALSLQWVSDNLPPGASHPRRYIVE